MIRVCAIVVTHNRREALGRCLGSLTRQTRPLEAVLVVDNASTDGSATMVSTDFPGVEVLRLPANEGGGGGFHEGLKVAQRRGFEWMWLVHDDAVPAKRALEELLEAVTRVDDAPALLASKVIRSDGELDDRSIPQPDTQRVEHALLAYERGLQPLRWASFVSLLVSHEALARHGLPMKTLSGGLDGLEFTSRVLRREDGYLAPRSVVEHRGKVRVKDFREEPAALPAHVRDRLLMLRTSAWSLREKVFYSLGLLWAIGLTVRSPALLRRVLRAGLEGVLRPIGAAPRSAPTARPARRP